MRNRLETVHSAVSDKRCPFRAARAVHIAILAILWSALACVPTALAQEQGLLPALEPGELVEGAPPAAPTANMGSAAYFSQELGSLLRVRYNTESYGQEQRGNLDIGSMQVFNYEDAITFIDGQVTLNDVQGVGFNVGVGCRWLDVVPFPWEPERMLGVSVWADGTSTEVDNFFPQVGVSYESLGDMWDFRANGYIPLGKQDQTGPYVSTGEIGFDRNFLSEITQATVDHSLNVGELEVARRLGAERDAWFFGGGYALVNDDEDAVGYRLGLRGYAYPDVLLQIAVSDDEIFKTNAAFSLTWFVGRTRTNYRPTCGLPDRFREPVMRNDYVALTQTTVTSGIPLTDTNGDVIRFVHVDSEAAGGGDGTYENPLNDLDDIYDNSRTGDIVLAWADSQFTGQSAVLRDDQRFLGEGDDMTFTVATTEYGTIDIPETSPGARSQARPIIQDSTGDAITLADNNEVANFTIDGGQNGIVTGTNPTTLANLHDLGLQDVVGSGILIDDVEDGIIAIADVTSTGGTGFALDFENILNVDGVSSVSVDAFEYDGGAGAAGGIRMDTFDGTFALTNSTLTGGTQEGVSILNASSGTFAFGSTNSFDDIAGTTFLIDGGAADEFTGTVSVSPDFISTNGRSISINNIGDGASITFFGDVTDQGEGLLVNNSVGGDILFAGDMTFATETDNAITLTDNSDGTTDTTIDFQGELDITTTSGTGFYAEGGGTLFASTTTNSIQTETGTGMFIDGMTIGSTGVVLDTLNITQAGATNAGVFRDNTGGPINVGTLTAGTTAGDNGTIAATTGNTFVIDNSANVTISGLVINNGANAVSAVAVSYATDDDDMTVNLNDLEINGGAGGIAVNGSNDDTVTLTMTINDTEINDVDGFAVNINQVDDGTILGNNVDIDGGGAAISSGIHIADSDATIRFDADSSVTGIAQSDFEVDGGAGTISMAGDITNDDGDGRSIYIHDITGGSVTMTGTVQDTSDGIEIADNTDGTISLLGDYTLNAMANDRFVISGNADDVDIDLTNLDITASGTGTAFLATGGGTLTITSIAGEENTLTSADGPALDMDGMTISTAGVQFDRVDVTATGTGVNGIVLADTTGGTITIGPSDGDPGDGGTITGTTGDGISITNVEDVVLNNVNVGDAGGDAVALVWDDEDTDMSVALNDLAINNTTGDGLYVEGASVTTGSGEFNVTSTNGTITAAGTASEVTGYVTDVALTQDITNTAGRAIYIHDMAGGTVTHTGSVTDSGTGILVTANDDTTIGLLGDYTIGTSGSPIATDAVTVSGNTGTTAVSFNDLTTYTNNADGVVISGNDDTASIAFTDLDITATGTGVGFTATGGGDLTVTGNNNVIDTATGTGLHIDGMNIVSGATFESVSTNGATNGILLNDITGATITVGDTGAVAGAGGTIQNTTGSGISITDTANVVLNGVTVDEAGSVAGVNGVEIAHTGSTAMNVTLNDLTVTNTTADRNGVDIDGSAGAGTFNVNVSDLDVDVTGDGFVANDGVTLTASGSNTITTETGVGLNLTDTTIGGSGATFESVNVTNGATNGIVLTDVSGGQVAVTGDGTTANSGGQLTTTGDAIVLNNVASADLNLMRIVSAGGQGVNIDHTSAATNTMDVTLDRLNIAEATGEGVHVAADNDANDFDLRLLSGNISDSNVVMDVTGAAHFGLLVDDTSIATDSGSTDRAFDLQFHDEARSGDITIRNSSNFVADDAEALFFDSYDAASKDIKMLVQDSDFTNNNAAGTEYAADIRSRGTTLLQATIQGNTFSSAGATHDMAVQSSGTVASRIHLNLGGDASEPADFNNAVGQGTLFVSQAGTSVFSIYERDDTLNDLRNNSPVDDSGTFQSLPTEPPPPIVP